MVSNPWARVNQGLILGWLASALVLYYACAEKSTWRIIHSILILNRLHCTEQKVGYTFSAGNVVNHTHSESTQFAWRHAHQKITTVQRYEAVTSLGIRGPTHKLWRRLLGKKFLARCNSLPTPRYASRTPLVSCVDRK